MSAATGPKKPTVSVIIASNRGGPYLTAAVESVRAQTIDVDEILLVDDGSPAPGLGDIARTLGVECIRQAASGVSVARNRGVAASTGEWIALLDDDDVWHPEKIAEQLQALGRTPGAIACYSDLEIIDTDGRALMEVDAPTGSSLSLIERGNGVPPINTLLISRDAYVLTGGCRPGLHYAEDIDLVLRLLRLGQFVKVARPLTGYRKYPDQVTGNGFESQAGYLRVVRDQIRGAAESGDQDGARALRRHLRRTVPNIADWAATELLVRIKQRRGRDALTAARWGIRHTRFAFTPAVVRTAARRLSRNPR